MSLPVDEVQFVAGNRRNPHAILGLHEKGRVVRLWSPKAKEMHLYLHGKKIILDRIHPKGLFQYRFSLPITANDYQVTYQGGRKGHDPYAFLPTFTQSDESLFSRGRHLAIYRVLGGRLTLHQGIKGVKFAVWAPCAVGVSLIGSFNGWDREAHPMRLMGSSGVWELFIPNLQEGEKYQFAVYTTEGEVFYKADPYAFQGEMRPKVASVVCDIDRFSWRDEKWLRLRSSGSPRQKQLNIYEVHLGSWKRPNGGFITYREAAHQLATYCRKMGYTHVELLPIMGHPLDESWGYQVSGFYAISRRFGKVEDFQYLVDYLHRHQIGVILDWVPGHFPKNAHSLVHFDGSYLYEHANPKQGYHPQWTTCIFNFGRYEVVNFLLGSALFYLKEFHIDGIRVDAVSSMIYLDFGKKDGEWIPNQYGGRENLEAIAFLRLLTKEIKKQFPDVLLIAEESHAFPGVTEKVEEGGLGFDWKWSLGWMNDTLKYFQLPISKRKQCLHLLMHEWSYCFDEFFILPLSHDEVVHEKKSLLAKMPGNEWEKFANLRLLLSYMICHPGKTLLFMGGELGQWLEWHCKEELHWDLLQVPYHQKLFSFVQDLNHYAKKQKILSHSDENKTTFEVAEIVEDRAIVSYFRYKEKEKILCIHHFSNERGAYHFFPLLGYKDAHVALTTDSREYGGYGIIDTKLTQKEHGIFVPIPPLSTLIIELN